MSFAIVAIFLSAFLISVSCQEPVPSDELTSRLGSSDAALLSSLVESDTALLGGGKPLGGGSLQSAIPNFAKGISDLTKGVPEAAAKPFPFPSPMKFGAKPFPVPSPIKLGAKPIPVPMKIPMPVFIPVKPHAPIVAGVKLKKAIKKLGVGKKIFTKKAVAADIKIAKKFLPKQIVTKKVQKVKIAKMVPHIAKPKVKKLKPIVYVVEKPVKVYHEVAVPKKVLIPKFIKVPKPVPVPKIIPVPVKVPIIKPIPKIIKVFKPVPVPKIVPVKKPIPFAVPIPVPKIHKVPILKPVPFIKPIPIPIPKPFKKFIPVPVKKIIKVPKPYYVPVKVPHITKSYIKTPMEVKIPKEKPGLDLGKLGLGGAGAKFGAGTKLGGKGGLSSLTGFDSEKSDFLNPLPAGVKLPRDDGEIEFTEDDIEKLLAALPDQN